MSIDLDDFASGIKEGLQKRREAKQAQERVMTAAILGRSDIVPADDSFNVGGMNLKKLTPQDRAIIKLLEDPLIGVKKARYEAEAQKALQQIQKMQKEMEYIGKQKTPQLSAKDRLDIAAQLQGLGLDPAVTGEVGNIIESDPYTGTSLLRDIQAVKKPSVGTRSSMAIGGPMAWMGNLPSQIATMIKRRGMGLSPIGEDEDVIRALVDRYNSKQQQQTKASNVSNLLEQLDALEKQLAA